MVGKALRYIMIVLTIASCTSGKKALERGDYYEAVIKSVDRLRSNPTHKKSTETLRDAYPLALNWFEVRITNLKASNDRFKWTGIVQNYGSINRMYEEIMRSPGALRIVPSPKNYYAELDIAKNNAAEENYSAGLAELDKGTREDAKSAYRLFLTANDFVAGYKDVNQKIEEARWLATLKVVIQPIPPVSQSLQVSADFFENKIIEQLHNSQVNEFVKFYTQAEAQAANLTNPDHILRLQFDEFQVGNVYMKETQIPVQRDSVIIGTYQPGSENMKSVENQTQANMEVTSSRFQSENLKGGNTEEEKKGETGNNEKGNTGKDQKGNNNSDNKNNEGQNNNTNQQNNNQGNQNNQTDKKSEEKNEQGNKGNQNDKGNQGDNKGKGNENSNANNNSDKGNQPNQDKVILCHKTGNGTTTITVAQAAVDAHLKHGDSLGECGGTEGNQGDQQKGNQGNQGNQSNQEKGNQGDQGNKGNQDKGGQGNAENQGNEGKGNEGNQGNQNNQNNTGRPSSGNYTGGRNTQNNTGGNEVPVYGSVKATVFKYSKTITSGGILDFRIEDASTGKVITQEKLPGEFIWTSEWATFNGDERALNDNHKEWVQMKEAPAPDPQTLFIEFTKPIYDQIIDKITRYYRNY